MASNDLVYITTKKVESLIKSSHSPVLLEYISLGPENKVLFWVNVAHVISLVLSRVLEASL